MKKYERENLKKKFNALKNFIETKVQLSEELKNQLDDSNAFPIKDVYNIIEE